MKRATIWITAALLLCSCAGQIAEKIDSSIYNSRKVSASKVDKGISLANNTFGFNVFKQLIGAKPDENCIISPLSIDLALSMLAQGAAGQTQSAIFKALSLTESDAAKIAEQHSDLLFALEQADPDLTLEIANSILVKPDYKLKAGFASKNQKYYDAEIQNTDFKSPEALKNLNRWVAEKTHGKIPSILENIEPDTLILLLNAVYFKGKWTSAFDEKSSKVWNFCFLDGKKSELQMMSDSRTIPYLKGDGFKAVKLGYGKQENYELWVFLPDQKPQQDKKVNREQFMSFANKIAAKDWSSLDGSFQDMLVDLLLPKFKCKMSASLNDCLQKMGMGIAFDDGADFSNMIKLKPGQRAKVSDVVHKTFIEVNEKGTEAAAATAVSVVLTSAMEPEPVSTPFVVDHPFVFGIRNRDTGAILFMGSIVDPQS